MATKVKLDYPWHLAPPWAKWAATDYDGSEFWYPTKPVDKGDRLWWISPTCMASEIKKRGNPCPHWRTTLQARPIAMGKASRCPRLWDSDESDWIRSVTKPKAKKVRKQWFLAISAASKAQAKTWLNFQFHRVFNSGVHAEVRYLPVKRGRKVSPGRRKIPSDP